MTNNEIVNLFIKLNKGDNSYRKNKHLKSFLSLLKEKEIIKETENGNHVIYKIYSLIFNMILKKGICDKEEIKDSLISSKFSETAIDSIKNLVDVGILRKDDEDYMINKGEIKISKNVIDGIKNGAVVQVKISKEDKIRQENEKILNVLKISGHLRVFQISSRTKLSEQTVRKRLDHLKSENHVFWIYGEGKGSGKLYSFTTPEAVKKEEEEYQKSIEISKNVEEKVDEIIFNCFMMNKPDDEILKITGCFSWWQIECVRKKLRSSERIYEEYVDGKWVTKYLLKREAEKRNKVMKEKVLSSWSPTIKEIAEKLGITDRSVRNYLDILTKDGVLTKSLDPQTGSTWSKKVADHPN